MGQEQIKQIKISIVGDQGTGKTSFVSKYVHDKFTPYHQPTLGV